MTGRDAAYWRERFAQLEQTAHKSAQELDAVLQEAYRKAQAEVEKDMDAWYRRFADNNGIVDMAEARMRLNAGELKEFKWTVDEYIRHGQENGITADWSKELENASARFHVTRLQALLIQMQNAVETLFGNQSDAFDSAMKDLCLEHYGRTVFELQRGMAGKDESAAGKEGAAGKKGGAAVPYPQPAESEDAAVKFDPAGIDEGALARIIRTPWTADGRNFSQRIWTNRAELLSELRAQLTQSLLLGRDGTEAAQAIAERFDVSRHKAARLVYTESAYFQSVAQETAFRDLGVEKYQFVATLDDRTSEVCREMDGQVFDMKDYQPGVTAPPLHPWCRSVTAPWYADLAGVGQRAARDPESGKTYTVSRDTAYAAWAQSVEERARPNAPASANRFLPDMPKYAIIKLTESPPSGADTAVTGIIRVNGQAVNPKMRWEKQQEHIWGTPAFQKRTDEAKQRGDPRPSAFFDDVDVEALVRPRIGTGKAEGKANGVSEYFTADKNIGWLAVDRMDDTYEETNRVCVRYSKKGWHAFPTNQPKEK